MSPDIAAWLKVSDDDLEMARLAFDAEKYNHVVVSCQQALEKRLKALIIEKTGELPPRIHDLTDLAAAAGVEPSAKTEDLFLRLTRLYITARYPEEAVGVLSVEERDAQGYLGLSEEAMAWIDELITQLGEPNKQ